MSHFKFDLHIHSNASYDSNMELRKIIRMAKKRELDGIAITDHEKLVELPEELDGVKIVKGQEIKTEIGDIMGLFLNQQINETNSNKVIEEIRRQGGIVVLPHPANYHIITEELISKVDLIETFNSQLNDAANTMGLLLANKYNKMAIAGSDAHNYFQIGLGITSINSKSLDNKDLKEALLKGNSYTYTKYLSLRLKVLVLLKKIWRKYA